MLKKLKNWLTSLKLFNKETKVTLPFVFDNSEKIARSIFSPVNVTKTDELRANAFGSPPEIDEVSVNRLDYTTPSFCKKLSKKIEQPSHKRTYYGIAILKVNEIEDCDANIVYSPVNLPKDNNVNPFHSDIKVGFRKKRGKELPAEFAFKVKKMAEISRFYKDPDPNTGEWTGAVLE
jgi:hypothetical protein